MESISIIEANKISNKIREIVSELNKINAPYDFSIKIDSDEYISWCRYPDNSLFRFCYKKVSGKNIIIKPLIQSKLEIRIKSNLYLHNFVHEFSKYIKERRKEARDMFREESKERK